MRRAEHPRRRPRGRCSAWWRPARRETEALGRGVQHLVDTQKADGDWDETLATGTGFPNVFYLRYTLYRNYFPLLALTHARRALDEAERALRLVQESEPSRPIR